MSCGQLRARGPSGPVNAGSTYLHTPSGRSKHLLSCGVLTGSEQLSGVTTASTPATSTTTIRGNTNNTVLVWLQRSQPNLFFTKGVFCFLLSCYLWSCSPPPESFPDVLPVALLAFSIAFCTNVQRSPHQNGHFDAGTILVLLWLAFGTKTRGARKRYVTFHRSWLCRWSGNDVGKFILRGTQNPVFQLDVVLMWFSTWRQPSTYLVPPWFWKYLQSCHLLRSSESVTDVFTLLVNPFAPLLGGKGYIHNDSNW